jgi:arylsulfatase A-like enzyme
MALALWFGLYLSGCSTQRRAKSSNVPLISIDTLKNPNVLLISIDTLRKDHCSAYGYERDTTPNLHMLAEQGARFDRAYAPSASTAPSHATMFTSLYPVTHQVLTQGHKLSQEDYTLAEHLSAIGYQTAAVVASYVLDAKFGFAQGFTFYDDDFRLLASSSRRQYFPGQPEVIDQIAGETTWKAIAWLMTQRNPERPFFLFVHYIDPHAPYVPPEPFLSRFAPQGSQPDELENIIGRYDGEIAYTDLAIGSLFLALKNMGLEENTLVVVTADHGEGLGQHDHLGHSHNIYEEAVRVPFLFRFPNRIPRGCVFDAPVEQVDIVPTILDLLGVKKDGFSFQGRSLAAALRDGSPLDVDRPVYLYREVYKDRQMKSFSGKKILLNGEKLAIRTRKWKYIEGEGENTRELFDLVSDPREQVNLTTTFPGKTAELATQLKEWKKRYIRINSVQGKLSEEDIERLRALGYVK